MSTFAYCERCARCNRRFNTIDMKTHYCPNPSNIGPRINWVQCKYCNATFEDYVVKLHTSMCPNKPRSFSAGTNKIKRPGIQCHLCHRWYGKASFKQFHLPACQKKMANMGEKPVIPYAEIKEPNNDAGDVKSVNNGLLQCSFCDEVMSAAIHDDHEAMCRNLKASVETEEKVKSSPPEHEVIRIPIAEEATQSEIDNESKSAIFNCARRVDGKSGNHKTNATCSFCSKRCAVCTETTHTSTCSTLSKSKYRPLNSKNVTNAETEQSTSSMCMICSHSHPSDTLELNRIPKCLNGQAAMKSGGDKYKDGKSKCVQSLDKLVNGLVTQSGSVNDSESKSKKLAKIQCKSNPLLTADVIREEMECPYCLETYEAGNTESHKAECPSSQNKAKTTDACNQYGDHITHPGIYLQQKTDQQQNVALASATGELHSSRFISDEHTPLPMECNMCHLNFSELIKSHQKTCKYRPAKAAEEDASQNTLTRRGKQCKLCKIWFSDTTAR